MNNIYMYKTKVVGNTADFFVFLHQSDAILSQSLDLTKRQTFPSDKFTLNSFSIDFPLIY